MPKVHSGAEEKEVHTARNVTNVCVRNCKTQPFSVISKILFIFFLLSIIFRLKKIKKPEGIQSCSLISTEGLLLNWFKFWNILDWQ